MTPSQTPDRTIAANNSAGRRPVGRRILEDQKAAISSWSVWTFWR